MTERDFILLAIFVVILGGGYAILSELRSIRYLLHKSLERPSDAAYVEYEAREIKSILYNCRDLLQSLKKHFVYSPNDY